MQASSVAKSSQYASFNPEQAAQEINNDNRHYARHVQARRTI
jgi:hypothetical protein